MLLLTFLLYEFSAKMVTTAFLMLFVVAYPLDVFWAELKCNGILASELEMVFEKNQ